MNKGSKAAMLQAPLRAFALTAVSWTTLATAEEQAAGQVQNTSVEEVVVTGTYIPRRSFSDLGSPVDVISRADIASIAPTGKISDLTYFIPQNVGHNDFVITDLTSPTRFGGGEINLRGLGAGQTLLLVDGRRQTRFPFSQTGAVDPNSMLPTLMVDRVEILKDGASSVYGTDAVGGVINFITRDNFEGAEFHADGRGTLGATHDAFASNNYTLGALFGSQPSDQLHVVFGLEYFQQKGLEEYQLGLPFDEPGSLFGSGYGMPGSYQVPLRDANGNLTGKYGPLQPDPDCQRAIDQNVTTLNNTRTDTFMTDPKTCRVALQTNGYSPDEKQWIGRGAARWSPDGKTTFHGDFTYSWIDATAYSQPSFPILNTLIVPGTNPGNPYRAVDAQGRPLYAQDADHNGIPDRGSNGQVILAGNPLDPASGIPFNEDVLAQLRPASTTNYGTGRLGGQVRTFRVTGGLDGRIGEEWTWNVGVGHSRQEATQLLAESLYSEVVAALNGQGGQTGSEYFNPFGSQLFAGPGSPLYNSPDVFQRMLTTVVNTADTDLTTIDGVMSGQLFTLPAGPLHMATGVQYRSEHLAENFDTAITEKLVSYSGHGEQDFSGTDRVWAFFGELAIPVFKTEFGQLDLDTAIRHERESADVSSTNPKLSALFRTRMLDLRASYARSFTAANLFEKFGERVENVALVDPLRPAGLSQVSTQIIGNAALKPQKSTSYNFGLTVRPLDSLSLALDYWKFDFTDILAAPSAQGILDADPHGPLVIRDSSGAIVSILRPIFNASSIKTSGTDIDLKYSFPAAWLGRFAMGSNVTWVRSYNIRQQPGDPVINGVGSDNNGNIGAPIAAWRGTSRLAWNLGRQSANLAARFNSRVVRVFGGVRDQADAAVVFDAQYSYAFEDPQLTASFGAINVFNNEPNRQRNSDGPFFISPIQDPRGRVVYLSLTLNL
jgi:iron complex outermembrane recepter protein